MVDLTDRENGLKLVIELKSGIDPQSVIEALYRLTPLEESFGVNNVALVAGRPAQLGLMELLQVYLDHRFKVTRRRSKDRLDKRNARLHLIDGLQLAVLNIDEVIELIRTSDTAEDARSRLMTVFDLSQLQADYILELRLRRLTKFSIIELEQEADQLRKEVAELEAILADETMLKNLVSSELGQVAKQHPSPRRTELIDGSGIAVSRKPVLVQEIEDSPAFVTLDPLGRLYRSAEAGKSSLESSLRSDIGLILSDGTAHRIHVADLPEEESYQAAEFLGTRAEVLGLIGWDQEATYAIGTAQGVVKRFTGPLPDRDEVSVIALKEHDEIVGCAPATDSDALVFVTSEANVLVFDSNQVRPQGLPASGMAGIKLDGARAIFFGCARENSLLVTAANNSFSLGATDAGSAKLTPLKNYPKKGRATMGVRCQKFLKGEDQLYFAGLTEPEPVLLDGVGAEIPAPAVDDRRDGSGKALSGYLAALG